MQDYNQLPMVDYGLSGLVSGADCPHPGCGSKGARVERILPVQDGRRIRLHKCGFCGLEFRSFETVGK